MRCLTSTEIITPMEIVEWVVENIGYDNAYDNEFVKDGDDYTYIVYRKSNELNVRMNKDEFKIMKTIYDLLEVYYTVSDVNDWED